MIYYEGAEKLYKKGKKLNTLNKLRDWLVQGGDVWFQKSRFEPVVVFENFDYSEFAFLDVCRSAEKGFVFQAEKLE
jgi:hypothetical protein